MSVARVWWRLPLVAGGDLAFLAGLCAGLLLLGLPASRPALADVHGPVLVLDFVDAERGAHGIVEVR